MAAKPSVSLSDEEVLELRQILTDADEAAALKFLREVIWHRVKAANRTLINPRQGTGSLD